MQTRRFQILKLQLKNEEMWGQLDLAYEVEFMVERKWRLQKIIWLETQNLS